MFTGLVREIATVKSFYNNKLTLLAKHKGNLGDSIAVNGACLTIIEIHSDGFSLELSEESTNNIALDTIKNMVHIEPALKASDRLDGHFVQGHIDGIGTITKIEKHKIGIDFYINTTPNILELCIPKGSICINGISLTINEVLQNEIRITIIPHTFSNTLFNTYQTGTSVNIETDMFARMIKYFLSKKNEGGLSWDVVDRILGTY